MATLATVLQQSSSASDGVLNLTNLLYQPEKLLRVAALLVLGLPVVYAVSRWTRTYVARLYTAQKGLIASKLVFYPLLGIIIVMVLREMGFSLAPLLGAAGILGIALGFASQTSVSNIISGFFLLAEEPFQMGDIITVGDVTGVVLTIDMLSVNLKEVGLTVLLAEQNVKFTLTLIDYGYIIDNGRICYQGPVEELIDNEEVRHICGI